MSKFFDTNYHYLVPELATTVTPKPDFSLLYDKVHTCARTSSAHVFHCYFPRCICCLLRTLAHPCHLFGRIALVYAKRLSASQVMWRKACRGVARMCLQVKRGQDAIGKDKAVPIVIGEGPGIPLLVLLCKHTFLFRTLNRCPHPSCPVASCCRSILSIQNSAITPHTISGPEEVHADMSIPDPEDRVGGTAQDPTPWSACRSQQMPQLPSTTTRPSRRCCRPTLSCCPSSRPWACPRCRSTSPS